MPVVAVLLFPARGAHGVVGQVAVLFAEGLGEAGGVAVALFGGTGGVGQGFVFVGRQAEGVRQVVSGGQLVGGVAVAVVACLLKPGARVCRVVPERGDAEQAHRGGIAAGGGFFQPLAAFAGVVCGFACGALPNAAAVRADVFARELGEPVVGVGFVVVGGEEEGGDGCGVVARLVGGKQGEDAARGVRRGVVLRGGLFVPLAGNSEVLPVAFAACVHLPKAVLGGGVACFGARLPVAHRGEGGGGAVEQVLAAGLAGSGTGDGGLRQRRQCGGLQPGGGEQGECKGGNEAGHGISLWRDGRRQCSNSRQKAAGRAYNPRLISPGVQVCAALWALWANPL